MKIKKLLVSLVLLSIITFSSITVVSANDDAGPVRAISYTSSGEMRN